jgi:cyanophycin synthetase
MEFWRLWVLRGPNAWSACPVIEVGLHLGRWADPPPDVIARVADRLAHWLPSLAPGDGPAASHLAHLVERVALELQTLAGNPVRFGQTKARGPGRWRVAVEYLEEAVGRACLQAALEVCRAACEGREFPIDTELARLRDLADDERLGPSTDAVVQAARARGIPVEHLNPEDGRYLQLGHGARQRRVLASETDDISAVSRSITTDKHLTKRLLRAAGVPVPEGRPVADAEDAWAAASELGLPVAVKPQDRDLAVGVGLDLRTREQVLAAYRAAREKSANIVVERFAPGVEHRVLVVDGRVVAVARIDPAHVIGDGESTVADLVEMVNRDPRRGPDHRSPLRRLKLDAVALDVLAGQGLTPASVPRRGERILVRRNPPYLKNGGSLTDLTDRIHPEVAARAVDAARALGLRVAGLDVVAEDVGRPLEEQGGVVVEVNTGPGLWLHTAPWAETPRPVGEAVVATLFPPGSDGRVPVVGVTGGAARTAAGRHLAGLLARAGLRVGRASAEGVFVAGRRLLIGGATAREQARAVLQNYLVDVAVLEASAGDLLVEGFGCDRCDVAVVTDPPAAGDGEESDEPAAAQAAVLRALAPGGTAVLAAEGSPPALAPDRVVRFAPGVPSARMAGGTAVFLSGDAAVLARGDDETAFPLPGPADRGDRLGLLAAVAAAAALNLGADAIRSYLASLGGAPAS